MAWGSYWGVDSDTTYTKARLSAIKSSLGSPAFWGGYLQGSAAPTLDTETAADILAQGIAVLPIYSPGCTTIQQAYSGGQPPAGIVPFFVEIQESRVT